VFKIEKPGIYRDVDAADYFADPCPEPSFTQSLAKTLIAHSPLHAKCEHPRLMRKDDEPNTDYDKVQAIGNAAHSLMLGRGKNLAVANYDNWMKKEAKEYKAEAIAAGGTPILKKHLAAAEDMVVSAKLQLRRIPECERAFIEGDAEVVIAACDDGLWLRSMIDWITPDLREVFDYKTTGQSVAPFATGKLMASAGWPIQAAMHAHILDLIDPPGAGRRRFLYVAQEQYEPFALTVNEIDEAAMTMGRKQLHYAIGMWRDCMRRNRWPAYPPRIIRPEYPGYAEKSWLDREVAEASEHDTSLMYAG
jgi:PDDEXK-like domain of unknown function (DUF3799)